MKIERLKLRGFRGIKKGLGLDEIEIDFSALNGLVALAGDNGTGKSTVLENMHPFRVMPSKKSSLYHQVYLRDSYRDLSFWFEGSHYRTLVKIDSQSEKSEGYIWKNHSKDSEVDGKVSNYDPYITNLLGSQNLFFNSNFCAQKSKKISDLTTGKLQGLFSEFLRLHELVGYENTSKQCITVIGTIVARIDKEIESLKVKMMDKVETGQKLSDAVEKEDVHLKGRIEITEKIEKAVIDQDALKDAIADDLIKKVKLKNLEQNLDRFNRDMNRELESTESELDRLRFALRKINDELYKCESLLKDKDKIRDACRQEAEILERMPAIEKGIDSLKKESDENDAEISAIDKIIDEQRRIIDAGKKDPEIARLETEIRFKHEKTIDLKKRDPACQSNICSFIVGSVEAQKELPELEEKLSIRQGLVSETIRKATEEIEIRNNSMVEINEKQKTSTAGLKAAKEEKFKIDNNLKTIRKLSEKKPDVAVAMSQKDGLEKRKNEITADGIRIRDGHNKSVAGLDGEAKKLTTEIEDLKGSIDNTLDDKKIAIESQIKEFSLTIKGTDKQIVDSREKIAVLKQSLIEKNATEKDMAVKKKEYDKLVHEQSEWIYLRNACGKDGLRQLELDCVAPIISGHANELLNMSFGSNDLIKFLTQDPEGREDIKIVVLREEEVLLDNLCGGEEVIILKALRLAMTLIKQEKSERRYESIFCDEEDGPLSVENAVKFIYLYESLMKIAKMDTCFYISHKKEAIALADHIIKFGDGRIVIN